MRAEEKARDKESYDVISHSAFFYESADFKE